MHHHHLVSLDQAVAFRAHRVEPKWAPVAFASAALA
jgi:hypothetical protein